MKVITLTQPWATLVAIGAKRIETRSWATRYRGPLAIHAAAGLGPVGGKHGLLELLSTEPFWGVLRQALYVPNVGYPADAETIAEELDYGAILGQANLFDCVPTERIGPNWHRWQYPATDDAAQWHMTDQERAFGDYSPGRFAFLLGKPQAFAEPIPARGQLKLWNWDGDMPAAHACIS